MLGQAIYRYTGIFLPLLTANLSLRTISV